MFNGFFLEQMHSSMKIFISSVSPSYLTFLKYQMSSGIAGIANCKVLRAGDTGSNGKQC